MKPVSTVDGSNYHLLGNQLRGESHSSRMARVYKQNNNHTPTLQPLGGITDFTSQLGGPLFVAALAGATIGLLNPGAYPSSLSLKKKGIRGMYGGAIAGAVLAGGISALDPAYGSKYTSMEVGQLLGLVITGALAGAMGHGLARSAKTSLAL
tara:strand:+ start:577 stop:1032 length:456 start_codon:yes stop_codon:yes gene_type:complete